MKALVLFTALALCCSGFAVTGDKPSEVCAKEVAVNVTAAILSAKSISIFHTTRALSMSEEGTVHGFRKFNAGRFGVILRETSKGNVYLVVQTEAAVGHLAQVDPGVTRVKGFVAVVRSEEALYRSGEGFYLTDTQLEALLRETLHHWGLPVQIVEKAGPRKPPTRSGNPQQDPADLADHRAQLLDAIAAIYANGDKDRLGRVFP